MAVLANNQNKSDHAVGLVAVSSLQGWLEHRPKPIADEDFTYQQSGMGASILRRILSTLTVSSLKSAFGYTINGHTALLARIGGEIVEVVGFNPESFTYTALLEHWKGTKDFTVPGCWYDDKTMIRDPTAICYEVVVPLSEAVLFATFLGSLKGRSDLGRFAPPIPTFYSFKPATTETRCDIVGNCGNMAFQILAMFLAGMNRGNYATNLMAWAKSNGQFGQGPLMKSIATGMKASRL